MLRNLLILKIKKIKNLLKKKKQCQRWKRKRIKN